MSRMEVCVCGGGNLAHALGGYLAAQRDLSVRLLTRHPEMWCVGDAPLIVEDPNGKIYQGRFSVITSDARTAVEGVDIVFICLPGFAIADELKAISPYISADVYVGSVVSSTGFFLMAHQLLPYDTRLFGFQRVPFIARIQDYGSLVMLLGYKSSLSVATENIADYSVLTSLLSGMFAVPIHWLSDYMKVTLTNSNPILHPSRLYSIFGKGQKYFDHQILFYEEWDIRSSEILIECDDEFQRVIHSLSFSENDVPSILSYYDSTDAISLTAKIRSIKAFKGLLVPMSGTPDNMFVPDIDNRYFKEDIPYGLLLVKAFAAKSGIATPMIDNVIEWAQKTMDKQYICNGLMNGPDLKDTIVPFVI